MVKKLFTLFFLIICVHVFAQKEYTKSYYENGTLKEEGWLENNHKIAYWKSYYDNGQLKSEGHYKHGLPINFWSFYRSNATLKKTGHYAKGKQNDWWSFYDTNGEIDYKCQFTANKKNGFCLIYKNGKVIKAAKYKAGIKINEWNTLKSFMKENKLSDLK
ncbi:MAG: hypothetical protein L3J14_02600 [Flavobacteriaceae bacterium]|nr:hypothetical protein [Flavobacteriaceae bacterium]